MADHKRSALVTRQQHLHHHTKSSDLERNSTVQEVDPRKLHLEALNSKHGMVVKAVE